MAVQWIITVSHGGLMAKFYAYRPDLTLFYLELHQNFTPLDPNYRYSFHTTRKGKSAYGRLEYTTRKSTYH